MKSRSILASLFGALILFSMATPAMAWTDGETVTVTFHWEGADDNGGYTINGHSGQIGRCFQPG